MIPNASTKILSNIIFDIRFPLENVVGEDRRKISQTSYTIQVPPPYLVLKFQPGNS